MKARIKIEWWLYVVAMVAGFGFLCPWLVSQPDTFMVLVGVAIMVGLSAWSWELWIKALVFGVSIEEDVKNDEVK